ncbi:hypothetical protein M1D89_20280 [Arthrobacter sp. D3-18]
MSKDTRPYFTLTNEYPRHRKIRTLSDKAFRLHVELIADCNEATSDGKFSKHELNMRGIKTGKELIAAGLVEEIEGGYQLHDYLSHQPSRVEIAQRRQDKRERGTRGGKESSHKRWHVDRGVFKEDCELCVSVPDGA